MIDPEQINADFGAGMIIHGVLNGAMDWIGERFLRARGSLGAADDVLEGGTGALNDGLGELVWTNTNRKGQTALEHVQKHGTPNYQREMHGVIRGDVKTVIEDAWSNRANAKIVSDGMGGTIYNIPYQNAGYNTGYVNFGQHFHHLAIMEWKCQTITEVYQTKKESTCGKDILYR